MNQKILLLVENQQHSKMIASLLRGQPEYEVEEKDPRLFFHSVSAEAIPKSFYDLVVVDVEEHILSAVMPCIPSAGDYRKTLVFAPFGDTKIAEKAVRSGVDMVLYKPCTRSCLEMTLKLLLNTASLERELVFVKQQSGKKGLRAS